MDSLSGAEEKIELEGSPLDPLLETGSAVPPEATGLVELYLQYTKDIPAPYVFRLWSAIHAVGAAVERRVWTDFGRNRLYPNLFVLLVGPPGTGKTQAIEPIVDLLRKSGSVTIAPNDVSKQSLLDALKGAARGSLYNGRPFDYHFLALVVRELANFMSKYDLELTGLLTDLFDCPAVNEERKRSHDKGAALTNPGISFIIGTATENLGKTVSTEMWGSGFMARVIMVFSAEEIIPTDMFSAIPTDDRVAEALQVGLRRLGERLGPMIWSPDAQRLLREFRLVQREGAPMHNRLTHYTTRRWLHLAKLCMIAALSDERPNVLPEDYYMALNWLLAAEADMPEIFKDMVSHEDGAIHEELRQHCFLLHMKTRKPVHASVLYGFLHNKVASHNVQRIIDVAVAAGFFIRVAGTDGLDTEYIPTNMHIGGNPGAL